MLYVTLVTVLLAIIVWFMPKHVQRKDILVVWITVSYVEIVVDLYLGFFMDLYYFAGEREISIEALSIKLVMAPLFGVIFVNYLPKQWLHIILYWLLWIAFSTLFEWTTVLFDYLTYTGWNIWLSLIFYILIVPLFTVYFWYTKHH